MNNRICFCYKNRCKCNIRAENMSKNLHCGEDRALVQGSEYLENGPQGAYSRKYDIVKFCTTYQHNWKNYH